MTAASTAGQLLPCPALFVALLLLAGPSSGNGFAGAAGPEPAAPTPSAPAKICEVEVTRDISYCTVKDDPSPERHRLDVFRPWTREPCPVVFFVHGGGWIFGKKDNYFGLYGYGTIARRLAERGFLVVLPNYRLSPAVRHPEHIKDVARAFAWTCVNAGHHGGDPRRIFLAGHSAGGHLVALLATDEQYLKQQGRSRDDIRGVVAMSGVYRLEDLHLQMSMPGPGGAAVVRTDVRPFAMVFGEDPEVAKDASPLNHVRPGLPPFLLINAQFDLPFLPDMASEFAAALKKNGCEVESKTLPWRTHDTMLFDIPRLTAEKATIDMIADFVTAHRLKSVPKSEAKPGRGDRLRGTTR